MPYNLKIRQIVLLIGDLTILYFSLFLTLIIRYGALSKYLEKHFWPFTLLFVVWLIAFYVTGLYEIHALKNSQDFSRKFQTALFINAILGIAFFYILPVGITPKTNLSIFFVVFVILVYGWRLMYNHFLSSRVPGKKILLVGTNEITEELVRYLTQNPQVGYEVTVWLKEGLEEKKVDELSSMISTKQIETIVVPARIKKSSRIARMIYKNLLSGIEVIDLADLYEEIFKKIPLPELEEVWFLENLTRSHRFYEIIKRPIEIILAAALIVVTLPLFLVIATVILCTSRGEIIFSQRRIGQNGDEFMIYKFRTMRMDAEKNGPQWATPDDNRVTAIGRFLRKTHLDELPQFWNILKGDLSVIGPRPERPEFVESLQKEIPFYELRQLIRPGISGWAQVNYRYGASNRDAYEKLQYEIYYLKNRSFIIDVLIILKTIKFFFTNLS